MQTCSVGERKVLDYGDVLLREQDVTLLEGNCWLNDQIVAFFLEFLERDQLSSSAPSRQQQQQRQGTDRVLLLPPSTAFLLMHSSPDMAAEVLAPLKPSERSLVVLPVNDNEEVDVAAGGSHWSLLVYHRPSNTLRHYDSSPAAPTSGRTSSLAARKLAEAVGPALSGGGGATAAPQPRLVEVRHMPRQTNGYDCGVYVLAVARAACEWWMRGRPGEGMGEGKEEAAEAEAEAAWEAHERGMAAWLTPRFVKGLRSEVLQIIRTKAADAGARSGGLAEAAPA